ncbi:hypothetical protein P7L78_26570 [Tistrella bauzanensis]|uniref:hypothetical protein n=1 Tax=Tistrella TaxID=171436 RepID=UPI0031F6D951
MKKAKKVQEVKAVAIPVQARLLWLGEAINDCLKVAEHEGSALIVCATAADDDKIMVRGQADGSQTLMIVEMMIRAVRDSAEAHDNQRVVRHLVAPLASLQAAMDALGVPRGRRPAEARNVIN